MLVIITHVQHINAAKLCSGLSAAGLHDATVAAMSHGRLEVTCQDDAFDQVIAALDHSGEIKTETICASCIYGHIKTLTLRACA